MTDPSGRLWHIHGKTRGSRARSVSSPPSLHNKTAPTINGGYDNDRPDNKKIACAERAFVFRQRKRGILYKRLGHSPLSSDEEQELLSTLNSDKSGADKLIKHNLRLVVYISKKFDNVGVGIEDLISIGTIGLIKAVNSFNPEKNIKLATYASRCIENEILMYIRKISNQKTEVSLDEPINMDYDGNELLLSDILGTDEDMILRPMEDAVDLLLLRQAVRELPPREKEIVQMRFGLDGHKELTQKEVAQKMGISQSYISRLEKRIMLKLRKEILKQTSCV